MQHKLLKIKLERYKKLKKRWKYKIIIIDYKIKSNQKKNNNKKIFEKISNNMLKD